MIMDLITNFIDSGSSVDWGSLFICEPIVGGTENVESMYNIQENINNKDQNESGGFNQTDKINTY